MVTFIPFKMLKLLYGYCFYIFANISPTKVEMNISMKTIV